MDPNFQWQPPAELPLPPINQELPGPKAARRSWLPAAILGSAIVIAGGLVAGALILKDKDASQGASGSATCQAWMETRVTLRSIPALPTGWNWTTPNIDTYIKIQNAPVGNALDRFETKIAADPADVAQAAHGYVSARRRQMQLLADHAYTPADGTAVDEALAQLNQVCGIEL